MKYLYYIMAIVIVFSGLAAYGLFDTDLEISKPVISVNDRIISASEFEKMRLRKPAYMTEDQFIDSIIDRQLLIQEAIRMDIHKEENFRQAVERFYEQSLIKVLLDRKLSALKVEVTDEEMAKYEDFIGYKFFLTKRSYPSLKDLQASTNERVEKIETDFIDLSDDLKFVVLTLEKGQSSTPKMMGMQGIVVFRLDDIQKKEPSETGPTMEMDMKQVSLFIQDKKKQQRLEQWTDKIREQAEIWRKK